jgi:hypothetical protein
MKGRKRVRFVWAATTYVPPQDDGRPGCLFTVAGDTKGRTWERFSDLPLGQWKLVETPEEPNQALPQRKERSTES